MGVLFCAKGKIQGQILKMRLTVNFSIQGLVCEFSSEKKQEKGEKVLALSLTLF